MSTNFKTTFTGLKSTSQNTFIQILAQASVKPAYFPLYYRGRSTIVNEHFITKEKIYV
jgi:hypothetical protein